MFNFCLVRGFTNLFSMQKYGYFVGFENENSYNEGERFLKLCRDFPQNSFIFRSFIRIFAGSYEKISLVHHYLASIRGHCRLAVADY